MIKNYVNNNLPYFIFIFSFINQNINYKYEYDIFYVLKFINVFYLKIIKILIQNCFIV